MDKQDIKTLTDEELDKRIEYIKTQLERYSLVQIYYEYLMDEKQRRKQKTR